MRSRHHLPPTAAVLVALLLTACSAEDNRPAAGADGTPGPAPLGTSETESPAPTPVPTPVPTQATGPECADAPGRDVEQLPDVVVPAVEVAPVTVTLPDGEERVAVEGFTIPAQLVDAGCVIRFAAPGGCLGAVEITGASIPPVTIPGGVIAAMELGDGTRAEEQVIPEVTVPGASRPAVRTEQVCQVETDGELPTVSRAGVVREGFSRSGAARPGASRGEVCGDSGCIPAVRVEAVRLDPVRLPDVDVDPARLESRELADRRDVDVLTGQGKTSYVAPGDVLFDSEQWAIRPDAEKALRAIAAKIRKESPGARLLVEGHTDDRGDETYGLRLSERRARAVAAWLVRKAGFAASRITTKGLGEAAPVAPNTTPEGRQKNRRVVITVTSG